MTSCGKDPIKDGASVTVQNTLESLIVPSFETETNFGAPATADVGDDVEFAAFVGIYDIDVSDSQIEFSMSDAAVADSTISGLFRTIEDGTFDRYYFTFDEEQKFESATSSSEFVDVSVTGDTEVKVEVGSGFVFGENAAFTLTLDK